MYLFKRLDQIFVKVGLLKAIRASMRFPTKITILISISVGLKELYIFK